MISSRLLAACFVLSCATLTAAQDQFTLKPAEKLPTGVPDKIAGLIDPKGHQIVGPSEPLATIWLAKDLAVKPDFKPTLNVKYPFTPGQLIGVMQVHAESGYSDFRGQEVPAGVYTLRYGQQPVDGNHVGTSETYDFLLAIPAANDTDPAPLTSTEDLAQKSAQTAGSNHPAIYSLLAPDGNAKRPGLTHDADQDFWMLHLETTGKKNGQSVKLPLQLIVIGVSEA